MILFKSKKIANMAELNRFVARALGTVIMVKPDTIAGNVAGLEFASTINLNPLVKNAIQPSQTQYLKMNSENSWVVAP